MVFKIIDNKKVDLTYDEAQMYDRIVKSYTSLTNKGEDLFTDLFEVDDNGIILFLKPPSKRHTSFEVFLFLMAVQQQQHIRLMYKQVEDIVSQFKNKMKEIDEKLDKLPTKKEK
jgi:hypothetical protein